MRLDPADELSELLDLDEAARVADVSRRTLDRWEQARVLCKLDSRRRTLVRCQEELLSDIPRLVHFAQVTLRDMARPYLDQETP
ncbi:hypothetical protein [Actinomadura formosensis]|uniref:hypothetical protein n=1 Tax=Actinomadura formosensis TaxID=60706 RepID=UPI003D8BADAB